ncbi:hypothetical protein [Acinetobacter sp. YH1901141]|uniref:hypothetical protein n=1 Tax=Acinetobacter sp. YH1901141 TaxID=2601201 RepID=UPI0015D3C690|nr:hypothetical protein [Acinetobacter sp. YH1901141]
MDIQKIKELALANGFKLKEQASGDIDLNAYVYDFANAIELEIKAQAEKSLLEQFEINAKLTEKIESMVTYDRLQQLIEIAVKEILEQKA